MFSFVLFSSLSVTFADEDSCRRLGEIYTESSYEYKYANNVWYTRRISEEGWISLSDNELEVIALENSFPCEKTTNKLDDHWVGIQSKLQTSPKVLYYNALSLIAIQYIRELDSLEHQLENFGLQLKRYENEIETVANQAKDIGDLLDKLVLQYPNGLPDDIY